MKILLPLLTALVLACALAPSTHAQTDEREQISTKVDSTEYYRRVSVFHVTRAGLYTSKRNLLIADLILSWWGYNATYLRSLNSMMAVGSGAIYFNGLFSKDNSTAFGGFGVNGEYRFYPFGHSPEGLYLSANLGVQSLSCTYTTLEGSYPNDRMVTRDGSATGPVVGADIGWQWTLGDVYAIGVAGRLSYVPTDETADDYYQFEDYTGRFNLIRFTMGALF